MEAGAGDGAVPQGEELPAQGLQADVVLHVPHADVLGGNREGGSSGATQALPTQVHRDSVCRDDHPALSTPMLQQPSHTVSDSSTQLHPTVLPQASALQDTPTQTPSSSYFSLTQEKPG